MSATSPVVISPVIPPPAKPTILAYSLDALKIAVAVAAMPSGLGLLASIIGTDSPILNAVVHFGLRALAGVLPQLTATTITDEDIAAQLKTTGSKVDVYDPMANFQKALVEAGG